MSHIFGLLKPSVSTDLVVLISYLHKLMDCFVPSIPPFSYRHICGSEFGLILRFDILDLFQQAT